MTRARRSSKEHQAKIRALAKRFGIHADYREKKWHWRHYMRHGYVENWMGWEGSGTEEELIYFLVTIKMGGTSEDAEMDDEDKDQSNRGADSDATS